MVLETLVLVDVPNVVSNRNKTQGTLGFMDWPAFSDYLRTSFPAPHLVACSLARGADSQRQTWGHVNQTLRESEFQVVVSDKPGRKGDVDVLIGLQAGLYMALFSSTLQELVIVSGDIDMKDIVLMAKEKFNLKVTIIALKDCIAGELHLLVDEVQTLDSLPIWISRREPEPSNLGHTS